MGSLIYLAAAIPFAVVFVVIILMAALRCKLTDTHVVVSMFGVTVRSMPLREVASVEFLPADSGGISLFQHGRVLVQSEAGAVIAVTPKAPESFAAELKDAVHRATGRKV